MSYKITLSNSPGLNKQLCKEDPNYLSSHINLRAATLQAALREVGRKGGKVTAKLGLGVHAQTTEERAEIGRKTGMFTFEQGLGVHSIEYREASERKDDQTWKTKFEQFQKLTTKPKNGTPMYAWIYKQWDKIKKGTLKDSRQKALQQFGEETDYLCFGQVLQDHLKLDRTHEEDKENVVNGSE